MSTKKSLNIYYYRIEPLNQNPTTFKKELKQLSSALKIENPSNSNQYTAVSQTNGKTKYYGAKREVEGLFMGTFTFIQLENIPPKQDLETMRTNNLDLEESEGLGYQTAYLFDPKTNIFLLVNRRPGVTLKSIKRFLEVNFDLPEFVFVPVIRPSKLQQFLRKSDYSKITLRTADVSDKNSVLSQGETAFSQIGEGINKLAGAEISLTVKSQPKETLTKNHIVNFVSSIFRNNQIDNFKELKVWGSDDVETETFDFITNRMMDKILVTKGRFNNFRIEEVYSELLAKFGEHKVSLRNTYKIQ